MERIEVTAYAGRKGDERPQAFLLRGISVDVLEIVDRWIEERLTDRVRKRCFKVKGSDGKEHILYYLETSREWYCSS